ncbi:MAG: hypothetical protein U0175_16055 [Caldilineaceae bacterium]
MEPTVPTSGQVTPHNFFPLMLRTVDPNGSQLFFPLLLNQQSSTAYRIGYGNAVNDPSAYPEVDTLRAGWFTNWRTSIQPIRPGNAEYVQMIRVHQKLACGTWFAWNREACPYATPNDYVFRPDAATIQRAAQANPGAIWLIGNEMDRVDFFCGDGCSDGQDEMIPETYARAYHDLYQIVKSADPSARVAIGGLIQPTPLRLEWLSIAWDTYRTQYNSDMPVDILNIHNFILQEDKFSYGAAVPPGLPGDPTKGAYINDDFSHIDHVVFDQQIRAMRQWMKDRNLQQKPLVITEYGVLYSHTVTQGNRTLNFNDPTLVHDFMLWTFDYYLTTKDCNLGFSADDCRLVQRWLWFSLDHAYTDSTGNLRGYFNPHTSLFNSSTKAIFPAGELFRNYVEQKFEELSQRWVN